MSEKNWIEELISCDMFASDAQFSSKQVADKIKAEIERRIDEVKSKHEYSKMSNDATATFWEVILELKRKLLEDEKCLK